MTRAMLALRGLAAAVVIVVAAVLAVLFSSGTFDSSPTITSSVAVLGSPIRPQSAVQYRGVRVGTLQSVEADPAGRSTLVMRMDRDAMTRVPTGAQVRILPLTLFGDQVVDLEPPTGAAPLGIAAGAALPADDSAETVALYTAYQKLYDTLNEIQPAKINMVLSAFADTLRGRGPEIGRTIDTLHRLAVQLDPLVESLGPTLDTVAGISDKLSDSAPDLFTTLRNATQVSQFLVTKQQDIAALLGGGIGLSDEAGAFFDRNHDDIITVVRTADPVVAVLARNPQGLPDVLDSTARAGRATTGLSHRSNLDAVLSIEDTRTYGPRDCPRYGAMAGPNCGSATPPVVPSPWSTQPPPGGTVGAVGSPEETSQLQQILPQMAPTPAPSAPDPGADGLRGLLLGPVLRGSAVHTS
ncbi:MCE family protein [Pseudonocardia sp. GCM10023141]|uniref:MCE family protein n=1 Tax=Pseudonocardia sp. GCM10023141 TaxID=3252653 RepID=UPI0036152807